MKKEIQLCVDFDQSIKDFWMYLYKKQVYLFSKSRWIYLKQYFNIIHIDYLINKVTFLSLLLFSLEVVISHYNEDSIHMISVQKFFFRHNDIIPFNKFFCRLHHLVS